MKKFIPTYHAQNIYEVTVDFFDKIGIKNVLIDLDNTLASYRQHEADEKAIDYIQKLHDFGYNVVIVSNNRGPRVASFAKTAHVEFKAKMYKPLKVNFKALLKSKAFDRNETILIGDQLLTDVFVANRVGIRSMLVEKLVEEDQWTTRVNRFFERPLRKRLRRKKQLIDWRTIYGTN